MAAPMATQQMRMSGQDWAILLILSVLWGGSFFFIEIAIETCRAVHPGADPRRDRRGLPLALAGAPARAAADAAGRRLGLPGAGLAQQRDPLRAVRLGAGGDYRRPRLDPQRDHADLGRDRRPPLHPRRESEPGQGRRRAARLRRGGGDDRRRPARRHRRAARWPSSPACSRRSATRWPASGPPLPDDGRAAGRGLDRPAHRRRRS